MGIVIRAGGADSKGWRLEQCCRTVPGGREPDFLFFNWHSLYRVRALTKTARVVQLERETQAEVCCLLHAGKYGWQ